jgi:hypothetical protein
MIDGRITPVKRLIPFASIIALFIIVLWISACSKPGMTVGDNKQLTQYKQVEQRLREFMDMRLANDVEALYNISNPEFKRRMTLVKFIEEPKEVTIGLRGYYLEAIVFESSKIAITYVTEYKQMGGLAGLMLTRDIPFHWRLIDNEWFLDRDKAVTKSNESPFEACGSSNRRDAVKANQICGS